MDSIKVIRNKMPPMVLSNCTKLNYKTITTKDEPTAFTYTEKLIGPYEKTVIFCEENKNMKAYLMYVNEAMWYLNNVKCIDNSTSQTMSYIDFYNKIINKKLDKIYLDVSEYLKSVTPYNHFDFDKYEEFITGHKFIPFVNYVINKHKQIANIFYNIYSFNCTTNSLKVKFVNIQNKNYKRFEIIFVRI